MKTRTYLPLIVFGALVIAAGTIHGAFTERWRSSANVADAVARLDAVPRTLGDWHGEEDALDAADLRRSGIQGHLSCRYRNVVTGEKVSLLIVCGRPGPISVHTPDVCYGGAGYESVGGQFKKEIVLDQGRVLPVWTMQFKSPPSAGSSRIEVGWIWNAGSGWLAPDNSRLAFARYPALYKLYVVRNLTGLPGEKKKDPSVSFLQTFLPELDKVLARKS